MAHENIYNAHLAELLRRQGLDAEAEVSAEGERIDVLVTTGGVRVAVEAKIANRRTALIDAEERLEQELADAAVAVSYPELERPREMTRVDAAPAFRKWRSVDAPELAPVKPSPLIRRSQSKWRSVDAPELARLIKTVADEAGDVNAIVKRFRRGLESAADRLTDEQASTAMSDANIPLPSKEDIRRNPAAHKHPRLRLALLVASAALFHANLDGVTLRRPKKDARDGSAYRGGGVAAPDAEELSRRTGHP